MELFSIMVSADTRLLCTNFCVCAVKLNKNSKVQMKLANTLFQNINMKSYILVTKLC